MPEARILNEVQFGMARKSLEPVESISSDSIFFSYDNSEEDSGREDLATTKALASLLEKATALGADVVALTHRLTKYHEDGREGSLSRGEKVICGVTYKFQTLPPCTCREDKDMVHNPDCALEIERQNRIRALEG